jgi:AraC family transcriptional regulator
MVLLRSATNRCVHAGPRGGSVSLLNRHGAMTVLPAGCGPAVQLTTPCEVTVYAFAPKVLKSVSQEVDGRPPPELEYIATTRDNDLRNLLELLDRELEAGGQSGKLYSDALAFTLLARALALSCSRKRALSFGASPLDIRAQQRLFEFIEANLHRNLDLEELASLVSYSRGHFLKMFRAATGTSPHQYLVQRRVERAKALLKAGNSALTEIAMACGFSSQSHFSAEFGRRVGISPARYRRVQ